jgi:prepilin-type N-terminal cleavage/methylation domain-containing protein
VVQFKQLIIEPWNLQNHKRSFTLFETLITLIILSIIISGFSQLFTTNISYQTYKDLQIIENEFYLNKTVTNTKNIKFIKL